MKLTIQKASLERDNLSLGEFIFLLIINEEIDIEKAKASLLSKGLIDNNYDPSVSSPFRLTSKGIGIYNSAIVDMEEYSENEEAPIKELAQALKDIYPKGKKDGTSYYWTDGIALIIRRLKLFYKKYGREYTNQQIIDATKSYVDSFNGNYKYMKLLKYFILKEKKGASGDIEGESDLLTYIENGNQVRDYDDNWTSVLK